MVSICHSVLCHGFCGLLVMEDNFEDAKPENLTLWMLVSIFLHQWFPSNDLFHHVGRIVIIVQGAPLPVINEVII